MILITGENGAGKGLAARVLHFNGVKHKTYIELNCATIRNTGNELFGHEAGAFTDAKKMRAFELADGERFSSMKSQI
jgi:DNA-binding NtrC family response regulator